MNLQDAQYMLTQLENEHDWYKWSLALLEDEILINGRNGRVQEIVTLMGQNRILIEERIATFRKAIAEAKVNIEGK